MATTTAIANGATDLNSILQSAMAGSYVAQGSGQTFTVSQTIVIHVTSTTQGPLGLDLGGGTIVSDITDGSPVIQVVVDPGVDLRYLTFSNLTIQGNGKEGDGIQIVAAGNDRWVYNFSVNNLTVNHVGGYGLDVQGSVFEGLISNSWMTNDGKGGAYFSHLDGGQVSALHWFGGGFENNGGAGLMLDNGARDMSVDGAKFIGNADGGISAASGITSVSNSDFQDNHGSGVFIQNYGNFSNNTFESSGAQTVGITGWLNGDATVVGNTSTWIGSGADPTTLANLQGYGNVYATGDIGKIVTGSSLSVSSLGGGDTASVTHSSSGVALPSLSAVTTATTAVPAATHTGDPVETALNAAAAGTAQHLTSSSYSVSSPIVIHLTSADQGPINIDFGGAKIQSNISNGGPVIEIVVDQGVNVSQLTISNLLINGNGAEGDGIKIVADGTDRSIQNLSINQVNVEHVGGIGLDVIGNVHGTVFDSWMHGNNSGGARFANGVNGGVADGLAWTGGGFRKNGVAGLILDNGTHDMKVTGAYFVDNPGVGIDATSGITLVKESGFENNGGTAVVTNGTSTFINDTFSTYGVQQTAIGGYLDGGTINISGTDKEYYGGGADTSVLANIQGSGTVAIAGSGDIVAGSGITVTGSGLTASTAGGVPAGLTGTTTTTGAGTSTSTVAPVLTEALVSDTGSSASDGITSSAALKGTADAGATIHFTVDGTAVATTATANASGAWGFTPTGLSDGQHTIVASETNAAGQTGSASLTFTLDTKAPTVTEALVGGGTSSSTGALTGTAPANAVVKFTVDGAAVTGTATADASGNWSYTPSGLLAGTHTVMASTTDVAGNTGSASLTFTTTTSSTSSSGTGTGATTTPSGTVPVFTGGSYANGQLTVTGTTPAANETVWIYDGDNWVGAVSSDASGKFTFTESAVSGSSHSFGAIAIDSTGAQTTTASAFVYTAVTSTAPPAAPTVTTALASDTGSSTTDKITSVATVSGTADPNATVHFTVDGTAITQTATANANGAWTFSPTGLADGQHTIVASETSTGGTGSASVTFTLDTKTPTVTSQLASDTGVSATDKITSNATISGTADPGAVIKFMVDGAAVTPTTTADASGKWSFTPAGLADGQHTVVATETDVAGNTGSASLTFTLDTKAPTITSRLTSDTGTSATDKITSNAAISGTADPNAVIKFTVDGTAVTQTATADATGKWSFTPTGLTDGAHTIVASETDAAGDTGSASLTFTLDTKAPTVTSQLASDTGTSATDKITSNAAISGTADPNAVIKFTVDGTAVTQTATADASGKWSFTPTGLADGTHTIIARETDAAGNTGSASLTFTMDAKAPTITSQLTGDTGASATDKITSKAAISGTADPNAAIKFTVDGAAVTQTATADASGKWSFAPTGLADGQHTVVASETDVAGNTGSAALTFTLDTKAPVMTETASATGTITGTGDANATVHFTIDGMAVTQTATADATGAWSYTPTGLAAGTHTVVASETDLAGNTGQASIGLTINTATMPTPAPALTVPVFTGASYANGQVTVTGTTPVANETVWIYDGSTWAGSATSDASGHFTFSEAAASGSTHSFGAIAIDSLGNMTTTDTAFAYTASTATVATVALAPATTGLPVVTGHLVSDTGASATDGITSNAALAGTADAGAVMHFAVDGTSVAATATADAAGHWTFTPSGLGDGFHTVVASETNAAGATGAATIGFTYDTHGPIPTFTGESVGNGTVTITGTTGEAGDSVTIYDGNNWLGVATTGTDGTFTYTANASAGVHSYGSYADGPAGQGHTVARAILGSTGTDVLVGSTGNDVIVGNGGNDTITGGLGADKLTGGSGNANFTYNAAAESTSAAADTITDFHHGDKIDFTSIAGINASNGTPSFQGYLTGTGSQTIDAHSVAVMEVGGNTQVLVNTTATAEMVTATDTHVADMTVTLVGVNLGLTGSDFHHN